MVTHTNAYKLKKMDINSKIEDWYEVFLDVNIKTIFAMENGKLIGTVNRDVFLESRRKSKEENKISESAINRKFVRLYDNGDYTELLSKAKEIIMRERYVHIIPVLNEKEEILYGFSRNEKNREHEEKSFYEKFTLLIQAGYSLADYFRANNIHKIAIYGTEELCVRLYNEVKDYAGVDIEFIMGHRESLIGDIKSIGWADVTNEKIDSVDVMIVTYVNTFEGLKYNLMKRGFKNVISIQNIVDKMYMYAFEIKPLIDYFHSLQKRDIQVLYVHVPMVRAIKNKSERETYLTNHEVKTPFVMEKFDTFRDVVMEGTGQWYDENYVRLCYKYAPRIVNKDGYCVNVDSNEEPYKVIDGKRITYGNPENPEHNVHVLGRSWTFGTFVKEEHTIPSQLQAILNNIKKDKYAVINHGVVGSGIKECINQAKTLELNSGDIVVIVQNNEEFARVYQQSEKPFIDLTAMVQRPHTNGELYIDYGHFNPKGNELAAREIYNSLFGEQKLHDVGTYNYYYVKEKEIVSDAYSCDNTIANNRQFLEYLELIKKERVEKRGKIGSIVMNCNPFTKGHRYLIEYAAKQMDVLYIFVVEEDKSVFKFKDRFEMVRLGTADLPNVKVIPSGKFIISSLTFPGYFVKGENNDAIVDTSTDLNLFAGKIAPTLEIKYRFAGSEPIDKVTKQYNQQMSKILPKYGIQFIEIERVEAGNGVISASRVRKLMGEGDWDGLGDLLPETTINYLKEHNIGTVD